MPCVFWFRGNISPAPTFLMNTFKQHYFYQFIFNINVSSGSLQAAHPPPTCPVSHTGSVPQGMLWIRGSWINMEALTPVSLLRQGSHQRQRNRWNNLWRFYDFQLPGGSDMMPHGETGGGVQRLECLCMFSMRHDSLSHCMLRLWWCKNVVSKTCLQGRLSTSSYSTER